MTILGHQMGAGHHSSRRADMILAAHRALLGDNALVPRLR